MKKLSTFNFQLSTSFGFTIIELLIVMALIGVLATGLILILNPVNQLGKARDAKRKADLRQIATYLNIYYQDNNKYPPAGSCAYGSANCYVFSTSGTNWIPALVPKYTSSLPADPLNTSNTPWNAGKYSYAYGNVSADGEHYDLFTQLENPGDPNRCELNNYLYEIGISPPGIPWCGSYSKLLFALDQ